MGAKHISGKIATAPQEWVRKSECPVRCKLSGARLSSAGGGDSAAASSYSQFTTPETSEPCVMQKVSERDPVRERRQKESGSVGAARGEAVGRTHMAKH